LKNSATSRRSKPGRVRKTSFGLLDLSLVAIVLAAVSAAAIWFHYSRGYLLWFGDAQAHLAIARRIIDSRTPGLDQIGTVWLPVPHLLMLPFVGNDDWWKSGLAGAIPSGFCFVLAGLFLYAAMRRLTGSRAGAAASVLVLALNPNLLYLQALPMTEAVFAASLLAIFYATVWYGQRATVWAVLLAAAASNTASLTRYEGWFLIPFVSLYFLLAGERRRWGMGILFGALAAIGPLYWLAHNAWHYGNPLEFYNGYYSAKMIYQRALDSGMERYPGDHDWPRAVLQVQAAAQLCAGPSLVVLGLAGLVPTVFQRRLWPLLFLSLPVLFYVWSMYSSGTPIYVPHLPPNSYYNTRYGLAALPLLALGAGHLVMIAGGRQRAALAVAVVAISLVPWIAYPRPDSWVTWKESQVNSEVRRAWTTEAAAFLRTHYRPGEGIWINFGDLTGILREAGIPLKESLHDGNHPYYLAAEQRPDLFLHEEWVVALSGDNIATALLKHGSGAPRYACVKMITVKGGPVVEIYRRVGNRYAYSFPESAWSAQ
jgi:hypothetical protein